MKKAKTTTNFVCQECGYDSPSWLGKCPECGSWNSFKEFRQSKITLSADAAKIGISEAKPKKLHEIAYSERLRIQTNFEELNTVLGGGIVAGSVTLIAGDPGVGKSTLLLQLALGLSNGLRLQDDPDDARQSNSKSPASTRSLSENPLKTADKTKKSDKSVSSSSGSPQISPYKVLYISGEESVEQIKMRAERISDAQKSNLKNQISKTEDEDNLLLLSLTDTDAIIGQIEAIKPDLVVVDSIQTIESQNTSGLSGSVAQVRYGALQLVRVAKALNIPIIIVGHVTKEGMVAGPMVLSHMVDTVLFLEGEKFAKTRILRSLKNRFGPVDEVGIFLMEEEGMTDATNPEQLFLSSSDTAKGKTPGSVLVSTLEGSRAFLVELQALTVATKLPMPRRVVSGVDPRRVELLLAVLQKHCHLPLDSYDVYVNVAGGMKLSDPAIDLGICLAVYSSLKNLALGNIVGIAEVGLLGELRMVHGLEKRIKEAEKLGFKNVLTAKSHKSLSQVINSLGK
ncbi:MAG TPA: AAA family ATPase [Patescibacteria group bacterium]|nr:AAA family ATPase [Patescibacteria group bacterium]